jgi:hypothetical protein
MIAGTNFHRSMIGAGLTNRHRGVAEQSGDALISFEPRAFRFSAQRSHAAAFGSN